MDDDEIKLKFSNDEQLLAIRVDGKTILSDTVIEIEKIRDDCYNLILNDLVSDKRKSIIYSYICTSLHHFQDIDIIDDGFLPSPKVKLDMLKNDLLKLKKNLKIKKRGDLMFNFFKNLFKDDEEEKRLKYENDKLNLLNFMNNTIIIFKAENSKDYIVEAKLSSQKLLETRKCSIKELIFDLDNSKYMKYDDKIHNISRLDNDFKFSLNQLQDGYNNINMGLQLFITQSSKT